MSSLAKDPWHLVGPVRAIDLQAVTEKRADRARWSSLQDLAGHAFQVMRERVRVVMIKHQPFGPERGALDLHPGRRRVEIFRGFALAQRSDELLSRRRPPGGA